MRAESEPKNTVVIEAKEEQKPQEPAVVDVPIVKNNSESTDSQAVEKPPTTMPAGFGGNSNSSSRVNAFGNNPWRLEEKERFIGLLKKHGKNFQ
jgi:hypothetical protein